MAANVALSQALAYARDLKNLYEVSRVREEETAHAHGKLRVGAAIGVIYAIDLKKTHRRLQRSIFQSLLGLANALEAKDECTRAGIRTRAALARRLALEAGLVAREADGIAQSGLLTILGRSACRRRYSESPGHSPRRNGPSCVGISSRERRSWRRSSSSRMALS